MRRKFKYRYYSILILTELIILFGMNFNEFEYVEMLFAFPERVILQTIAIAFTVLQTLFLVDNLYDYYKMSNFMKVRLGKKYSFFLYKRNLENFCFLLLNYILILFANHYFNFNGCFYMIFYVVVSYLIFNVLVFKSRKVEAFSFANIILIILFRILIR